MARDPLDEFVSAVKMNHPARPYLLAGAVLGGVGLMRNSVSGLIMLGVGAALLSRGAEEVRRVNALHGGNSHGVNAPPANV